MTILFISAYTFAFDNVHHNQDELKACALANVAFGGFVGGLMSSSGSKGVLMQALCSQTSRTQARQW